MPGWVIKEGILIRGTLWSLIDLRGTEEPVSLSRGGTARALEGERGDVIGRRGKNAAFVGVVGGGEKRGTINLH